MGDEVDFDAVLAEAAREGIHCLPVPTPFAVGRINCYLIEDERLTLIDAGPRSDQSLAELEQLAGEAGHRLEDIDLIVATHQHLDHIGLIRTVAERSGAEVAALDLAINRLAAFGDRVKAENDRAVELMLRHGVSEEVANGLREITTSFLNWGDKVIVTEPLSHGSYLELGNRRPMALGGDDIDLDQLKWVVLMVLFNQPGREAAFAWMEDLVLDEVPGIFH